VLCVAREGQAVSKIITGNTHAGLQVKTYRQAREAVEIVRTFLARRLPNL